MIKLRKVSVFTVPIMGGTAYIPIGAKIIGQETTKDNKVRLVFILERNDTIMSDEPMFEEVDE